MGYHESLQILDGESHLMSEQIQDETLDVCFLDADHRYEYVKRDIEKFLPKVKSGGILCGHDCEFLEMANTFTKEEFELPVCRQGVHAGVIQAVYESFGSSVILPRIGNSESWSVWVYHKP